jgi:hypothetical protein
LDGIRCLAISDKGLFSRTGKAFPHLNHIREGASQPLGIRVVELSGDD